MRSTVAPRKITAEMRRVLVMSSSGLASSTMKSALLSACSVPASAPHDRVARRAAARSARGGAVGSRPGVDRSTGAATTSASSTAAVLAPGAAWPLTAGWQLATPGRSPPGLLPALRALGCRPGPLVACAPTPLAIRGSRCACRDCRGRQPWLASVSRSDHVNAYH